jgi:translation initiation factor IF-2
MTATETEEKHLKVRIFALAKELGLDSKELIQHCNDAGIPVKNSALASISPEERDVVLAHMKRKGAAGAPSSDPAGPPVPVRDVPSADRIGKVRQIKTLGPLSRVLRRDKEETPTSAEPGTLEAGEFEKEPVVERSAGFPPAVVATAERGEPVPFVDNPPVPAEASVTERTTAATDEVSGEPAEETEDGTGVRPISRDDYVSPMGLARTPIREMRPRASIQESSAGPKTPKKAKKSSLPSLAPLPTFKAPIVSPSKKEGPAQKPDLPLTAEILRQQSPLADILRKNAETRKRPKDEEETSEMAKPGRASRIPLDDVREQRRVRRTRTRTEEDEAETQTIARRTQRRQRRPMGVAELKSSATIELPISVRGLSEEIGRPARDIMRVLFGSGKMVNINSELDEESVLEIGLELGVDIQVQHEQDVEDTLAARFHVDALPEDAVSVERPPIVTILGHVDHGKTTLLDTIRSSRVAVGEAGGITQHIAAYQVERKGKAITFVDTPGHAAFGEMRARGANVTDIVVLVVAADDGVMPQTVECISHAKASGAPMIVALNKCDLPDINETRILTELSQHNVLPAEWGGDTEVVRVSALKGTGIDNLLETILLTAELNELGGVPDSPAVGVCLEAFRDEGRGPIAWMMVRNGTLRVGDILLCGGAHGRIRAMYNDRDEELQQASPSTPVRVAGLDSVPSPGDRFYVLSDLDEAREIASQRQMKGRDAALAGRGGLRTLEDILNRAGKGAGASELPLIIKADTPGSIEALRSELDKFEHPEVRVKVLHEGVGGVNESDVYLASSANAVIIAFHVIAEDRAQALAEREGVEIRRYNIIYEVTDHIRQALEGLLRPERVEVATGRAIVLRTFHISRVGTIAGCRVLNGTIERNHRVHVIRDQKILRDYPIASLRREKDDVREVREGFECGIRLEGFDDVKEGDLFESFRIDEVRRTLDG